MEGNWKVLLTNDTTNKGDSSLLRLSLKKEGRKKERIPLNHHMSPSTNKQISRLCCSPSAPAAHNPPPNPPLPSFSLLPSTLWFPCLFMTGRFNGKSTSDRWVHQWGIWRIVVVMTSESHVLLLGGECSPDGWGPVSCYPSQEPGNRAKWISWRHRLTCTWISSNDRPKSRSEINVARLVFCAFN